MTDVEDLERDIAASRARLDGTLDRLQTRLNLAGLVEDALGAVRRSGAGASLYDAGLHTVRHNPLPVLLVAVGAALLLSKVSRPSDRIDGAERLPAVQARRSARIYTGAPNPLPSDRTPSKRPGAERTGWKTRGSASISISRSSRAGDDQPSRQFRIARFGR